MDNNTAITRTIEIDGKTFNIHIYLSASEVRRLLLPHVAGIYAAESDRRQFRTITTTGPSTFRVNPTEN